MVSGGSISPLSSPQSTVMKLLSSAACLRYISRTLSWKPRSASWMSRLPCRYSLSAPFAHEADRHVEEDVEVGAGQSEPSVFGVEYPGPELLRLPVVGEFRALVGDVGVDVPVEQHRPSGLHGRAYLRCGRPPVFGEQQRHELRMHGVVGSEVSSEELADEPAVDRGVVAGEVDVLHIRGDAFKVFPEYSDLGGFSRSVQAFQHD